MCRAGEHNIFSLCPTRFSLPGADDNSNPCLRRDLLRDDGSCCERKPSCGQRGARMCGGESLSAPGIAQSLRCSPRPSHKLETYRIVFVALAEALVLCGQYRICPAVVIAMLERVDCSHVLTDEAAMQRVVFPRENAKPMLLVRSRRAIKRLWLPSSCPPAVPVPDCWC